jgi:hypothetical protein
MSFFSGIDKSKLDFDGEGDTLADFLQRFGNDLTEDLKNSVTREIGAGTNLAESIRFSVVGDSGGYRFRVFVPEYGTFLDEGVQGRGGTKADGTGWINKGGNSRFSFNQKKPPMNDGNGIQGLGTWSTSRGLNPWAVQNAVFHQGIRRTDWYSNVVDENLINDMIKKLSTMGAKQVEMDFVKMIEHGLND